MCRHFAYVGPPVTLAGLVFDAPHSLAVQAYAPTDMRGGGTLNVDGFGVGWYSPAPTDAGSRHGAGPARRYRRAVPIWQDAAFADLASQTQVRAALGAVRSATPGLPVTDAACAPFTDGHWLFSLNGRIAGWPDAAVPVAETVPTRSLLTLDAPTDSALLWAALRHQLGAGVEPGMALRTLVAQVLKAAPESRLNLLLTDGRTVYATTVTHALWSRQSDVAVLLASEPFDDDPAWQSIPDGQLVTAERGTIDLVDLNLDAELAARADSDLVATQQVVTQQVVTQQAAPDRKHEAHVHQR
jgi:glutamine amidotransferase